MAMTLIEGVGDEVTLFFVLAVLAVVACLAWWTTRVTDRPLRIQTIIVGQRVIHVDERGEPATAAAAERAGTEPPGPAAEAEQPSCEEDEDGDVEVALQEDGMREEEPPRDEPQEDGSPGDGAKEDGTVEDGPGEGAPAEDGTVEDGPGEGAPAEDVSQKDVPPPEDGRQDGEDAAAGTEGAEGAEAAPDTHQQLRQRRLAHMARQSAEPSDQGTAAQSDSQRVSAEPGSQHTSPGPSAASSQSASVPTSRPDAAERTAPAAETETETAPGSAGRAAAAGQQSITVKLKFLNDTQRLVEGSRAEPLADFKRRHFPTETAANRLVRLIFNGRVLPDRETLDQCGLYHNCVVHCHVSAEPRPAAAAAAAATGAGGGAAPAELDIGVLLYPVLTSVVTLVWGLRLRYPELFSGMAVLLLAVLTLLLACFTAATFLPLDRLPGAQPAAAAAAGRQQQRGR